jgi:anthranilate synthase component 2
VTVERNDAVSIAAIARSGPAAIVMSPGPRTPEEAGICVDLVRELGADVPMLGVCLGHQAIGVAYGAKVVRAPAVVHGKVGPVHHGGAGVLRGLDDPFMATRYHSLVVSADSLPDALEATAWSDDGLVMAMRHRTLSVEGVQFHPESVGTPAGHALLRNFLETAGVAVGVGA